MVPNEIGAEYCLDFAESIFFLAFIVYSEKASTNSICVEMEGLNKHITISKSHECWF